MKRVIDATRLEKTLVRSNKLLAETGTSRRTMLIGGGGMMAAVSLRDAAAAPTASASADAHIQMNKGKQYERQGRRS
jgi:hypothetical protein